jgi:hypothetical protein
MYGFVRQVNGCTRAGHFDASCLVEVLICNARLTGPRLPVGDGVVLRDETMTIRCEDRVGLMWVDSGERQMHMPDASAHGSFSRDGKELLSAFPRTDM